MTEQLKPDQAMRVLVGIDGSEPAGMAVDLVTQIAWPPATEIVVAMAVETGAGLFGGPWPAPVNVQADRLEDELRAEATRTVDETRDRLASRGMNVTSVVLKGRAATAIVDEARRMKADLIIVGSKGHGRIASMLLGSVSAEVIDHAPVPVLVARGYGIRRVVLAWDGSSCAARAADLLCTWPIFARSAVRVVSATDVDNPWWTGFPQPGSAELMPMFIDARDASRRHHEELAHDKATELRTAGLKAEPATSEGDAASEIIAAAAESNADLIVMGTHGRTGLARLVLGSVARNVLQHATCSVLVVRETGGPPGY